MPVMPSIWERMLIYMGIRKPESPQTGEDLPFGGNDSTYFSL